MGSGRDIKYSHYCWTPDSGLIRDPGEGQTHGDPAEVCFLVFEELLALKHLSDPM